MKTLRKTYSLTIITILLLSLLTISATGQVAEKQPAARPAFRMPVALKSAEILPDNSVIFRLLSKDAASVTVSGDWLPDGVF